MRRTRTVLIVDDDDGVLDAMGAALRARGLQVATAKTLPAAHQALRQRPDLAILDVRLGEDSGLDLLDCAVTHGTRAVIVSGYASVALTVRAMRIGARAVLFKPATVDEILHAAVEDAPTIASSQLPSLQRVEWEHLQRALLDTDGNVSEAARRLKLPRRTLQRKLRKRPPTV